MSAHSVSGSALRVVRVVLASTVLSLLIMRPALANGPPASIVLQIVGGDAQDQVHALYQPGSSVQLGAKVFDASGQPADTLNSPCTPVYAISDNITPDGVSRARIVGDRVVFDKGLGNFTVNVHCAENPKISSESGQQPYNFQTSNSAFAKTGGEDFVQNQSKGGMSGLTTAAIVAGAALTVGVIVAVAVSAGGSSLSSGGSCQTGYKQCAPPNASVCCPSSDSIYCTDSRTCTNLTSANFGDVCNNGGNQSVADGC